MCLGLARDGGADGENVNDDDDGIGDGVGGDDDVHSNEADDFDEMTSVMRTPIMLTPKMMTPRKNTPNSVSHEQKLSCHSSTS